MKLEGGKLVAENKSQRAKDDLGKIPNYATWSVQEGKDYIEANVVADPSVKTVLKGIWHMCCLMRDYIQERS